jgi:acyl carrier protein
LTTIESTIPTNATLKRADQGGGTFAVKETRMSNDTADLQEIVFDVLRTDLKLGMIELGPETPLVGDELGLDSLDLLMVVTGTEKRLGIKIPNEKLGKDTMGTIGNFVRFVDSLRIDA